MIEAKEKQIRGMEQEVFEGRVRVISDLLKAPQLAPLLNSVGKHPRILDIYTGTGAGGRAVNDRLVEMGNKPQEITLVDLFRPISYDRLGKERIGPYAKKYTSGIEETKRNMDNVSGECKVTVCKDDILDYFKSSFSGKTKGFQLPFNLITAFSAEDVICAPLRIDKILPLPFMTRFIYEFGNTPTIFTFGSLYDEYMDQINSYLREVYYQPAWNLYTKPKGVRDPNWDKWILTNRKLDLERFESTDTFQRKVR